MDFLTVIAPEGTSARRDLDADNLRIGRASGNDLVLKDLNVSRSHAAIACAPSAGVAPRGIGRAAVR